MNLRKLTEDDLSLILVWRNAPEVRKSMYTTQEISEADHRTWFSRTKHDPQTRWYLHQNENDKPDGVVYFTQYRPENQSSFWDFYAAPDAPAGTGTKLGLDALDKAFYELNLHKLNAEVLSTNECSLLFHEKLGFNREGIFRDYHFDGEGFVDVIRLGILKSEWVKKRSEIKNRIAKLDAITPVAKKKRGGYKIMILSDKASWLNSWVNELAEEWRATGHECFVAHQIADAVPADFCFCLSFGKIVSASTRQQYKHTLVVHESSLPKGRGWSPMSWQILEGKNHIPITLLEAEDKVDAGSTYLQECIELDGTELSPKWRKLQAEATMRLCYAFISDYPSILDKAEAQIGEPTFYPRRCAENSQLDLDKTLSEQFNLLRVVDNEQYPAFFEVNGEKFTLKIESTKTDYGL
ncbi:MAG: UDP-4-amino-4,6-dideoxy-N-acetyl-beta-L-altrosamine N-acetyltransferase [Candidatus Marinimicrobia bacterium]|nr:UDP-4-amino-4,6-dideoxy-N-acetyl-beta-L-altrosamine N-acetyltransferase [Candidatus Neomarinimicrobiota bacterium]